MSELLKREKMARALFEVGAPPHQFWDDVGLDKRELYLCMADAALSQGSSAPAPTARQSSTDDIVPAAWRWLLPGEVRWRLDFFRPSNALATSEPLFTQCQLTQSAATSDMAITGDTQSDLSIAGSALVEDKAGASTVEPVAWQYRTLYVVGDEKRWGDWYETNKGELSKFKNGAWKAGIDEGRIQIRELYAAPTTSPEPDAVREAPEAFEARVIKTMREFLGDTAFEALTFLRWKDGIDIRMATNGALAFVKNIEAAALSRPAHGGWQDISTAPKDGTEILLWWKHCKTPSTGSWSIDDLHAERQWAHKALEEGWRCEGDACIPVNQADCTHWMPLPAGPIPRNQGQGGGPRS